MKLDRRIRITKGYLSSVLAADGESVFLGADRDIVHINGRTGREVWRAPAEGSWATAVVDDVLLATTWRKALGLSTKSGTTLYRVGDGMLRLWRDHWMLFGDDGVALLSTTRGQVVEKRAPLPIPPSDGGLTRIDGDLMLYQAADNELAVAYDLVHQKVLWKRPLQSEISKRCGCEVATVVLRPMQSGVFLAHVASQVVAGCSLEDGSILWDCAVPLASPVMPYRDRVYVMSHQSAGSPHLLCLDAATGARLYDVAQPELGEMDIAEYGMVHGEHIAFGTRGGLIGLFRLADGHLDWSYRHKVQLHTPVAADDRLYACADDGNLLVFGAA